MLIQKIKIRKAGFSLRFRRLLHNLGLVVAIMVLSLSGNTPLLAATNPAPPPVTATAAVLMDTTTGKLLFAKNPDARRAPASTTKILTALIALENGHLDDRITVGPNPPRVEGTRVYLVEGEKLTLENLLYAMLLNSGNDAALAIAEHFGGSEAGFASLMNRKARALGAQNSHFAGPDGLSKPQHYTTARDLAIIARAAMKNSTFRRIVATRTRAWNGQAWQTTLINQNRLLWRYQGANGIKTGYTTEARYTLVGSATREGQSLIAVVLDEPGRNAAEKDVVALLDYGFNQFRLCRLAEKGQVVAVLDTHSGERIKLAAADDLTVVLPKASGALPTEQLRLFPLERPVPANTRVGEMVFQLEGKGLGKVEVTNLQPLPADPPDLSDWWLRLTAVLLVLWFINRLLRFRSKVSRQRRPASGRFSSAPRT